MDVQMPIIDGYRATHVIRHHAPYSDFARHVPIVAMTASAIQGDREKCTKAGMDDYLAKPVKGKTLEKMIVKWALSRRDPRTPDDQSSSSECSEHQEHNCGTNEYPIFGQGTSPVPPPQPKAQRPTLSEHQQKEDQQKAPPRAVNSGPVGETEAERAGRRERQEEQAMALRNDKLVEAAGGAGDGLMPHAVRGPVRSHGQKLTVENIGRLEQQEERRRSSFEGEGSETSEGRRRPGGLQWRDSEVTVKGRR